MSNCDDKSITNQSSSQLDGVVDNLTVTNALVLNNPLAIAYGGTGLSSVGTAGQVLTSTGSGLQYTTPAGGGGGIAAVTASPPLFSSGGTAPNISCISTTGSGSVVLATAPTITAPLTVASVTTPIQTVVTDMSSVGTGIIRTSSEAFGLDISSGGYGLGNLKRVRLLGDTVTVTNSAIALGENNFFNVTLPANITTSYCSDILNFTNVNNTSNNSTQGIAMYTIGSPGSPRLSMGIRSGASYPGTRNTYFTISDTAATFSVNSGTGNTSFVSTSGGFSVATGNGNIISNTGGTGNITLLCDGTGGINLVTSGNKIRLQSATLLELQSNLATSLTSLEFLVTAPTTIAGAVGITGATTITGVTAITGATTITGAATIIGLTTTNELTVVGVTALGGAVGIAGLLGVTGSANFTGLNLFANVAGNVSLTSVLNADLVSGSGAVKIAADLGGVSIGGNGYGSVGNFQVNSKSGSGAFQTGNISFLIEKTAGETGPGNFSIDTLGAATGDMTVATKGLVSIRSNASTNSIRLNTAFITPSSYNWNYPSTAGTLNSLLLSGAGSAAMTWLAPGANATILTSNGTSLSWQPTSALAVDWTIPGTIGSTTPNTGAFTTLSASAANAIFTSGVLNVTNTSTSSGCIASLLTPSLASNNASAIIWGKGNGNNEAAYLNFVYNTTGASISSTWGFGNGIPGTFIRLNGDSTITMNGNTTYNGSITLNGQILSTLSAGTPPFSVVSTTVVPNLNVSRLLDQTWAAPAPIGSTAPNTGAFTTLSVTNPITSTLVTGTAPFNVLSTTVVPNLNVSQLLGFTWGSPGTIGSVSRNTGAFTTLSASAANAIFTSGVLNVTNTSTSSGCIASLLTPSLASNNASAIIWGKGNGNNEAAYLNFVYNTTGASISSTWGFGNAIPGNFIRLNGNATNTINGNTAVQGTLTSSGQIISTVATGTAPFSVASTTVVPNLNVSQLLGGTWASPPSIGSTTANTGSFTALSATASNSIFTSGVLSVTNLSSVSASVATFMAPTLGSGEVSNLIMGKGFGNSEAMFISYAHSAIPTSVSSTWGFGNGSPSTAITLRGNGDIRFQYDGTQVIINPVSVSASKTLCLDGGKRMISRIGGSNTIYESNLTIVSGGTFENVADIITIRTKGNGTLSWVDRGTGFKNQSGENLLVSISFTINRETAGFGNSSFRIILNNSIILAQQDIGGGTERITISAMTYLDNLETFQCQVRCISTVIFAGIIVTINTYPLVD